VTKTASNLVANWPPNRVLKIDKHPKYKRCATQHFAIAPAPPALPVPVDASP
jgi:hypothetical protein